MIKMEMLFIISLAIKELELFAWMDQEVLPQEEVLVHGMEELQNGYMRIENIR